jgi:hypothetical protein
MANKSAGGGLGNGYSPKIVVKEQPVINKPVMIHTSVGDYGKIPIDTGESVWRTMVDIPKVNKATESYIMSLRRLFEKKDFWNTHTDLKGFIQDRLPTDELQLSKFSLAKVEFSILSSNSIPEKIVALSQRYIEVVKTENEKLDQAVSTKKIGEIMDKCDTNISIVGDIEAEASKYILSTGGKKKSRKSKRRNVNKSKKYRKKYYNDGILR